MRPHPTDTTAPSHAERSALIVGIASTVVGMQMFIVQPGMLNLLVLSLPASEAQAGVIASAEMAGIALSTVLAAGASDRFSRRAVGFGAAAMLVAANLLSAACQDPWMLAAVRALAGIGSGLLISLGYSLLGTTANKDRAFAYVITAVLMYGALGIFVLPAAGALIGLSGIFVAFAGMAALLPAFFGKIPPAPIEREGRGILAAHRLNGREFAALGAVLVFFLGQGVVWAYLGLIGLGEGLSEPAVSSGLTLSQLAGIGGALSLVWATRRVSPRVLLLVGGLGSIVPLLALTLKLGALGYAISVTIFNFFANLMTPFLMALVAKCGREGNLVPIAAALQMVGLAIGPAASAALVDGHDFQSVLITGAALFAAMILVGLPTTFQLRNAAPGAQSTRPIAHS